MPPATSAASSRAVAVSAGALALPEGRRRPAVGPERLARVPAALPRVAGVRLRDKRGIFVARRGAAPELRRGPLDDVARAEQCVGKLRNDSFRGIAVGHNLLTKRAQRKRMGIFRNGTLVKSRTCLAFYMIIALLIAPLMRIFRSGTCQARRVCLPCSWVQNHSINNLIHGMFLMLNI